MIKERLPYIFYLLLIAYLLINTGLVSDDFATMVKATSKSFGELIIEKGHFNFIDTPVEHYTHYIWYHFFRVFNSTALNFFKIAYILSVFFLITQFFRIYLAPPVALLVSFLFIFFPSHDSTVYMFLSQYLTLSFALYLYAYYLAYNNRLAFAFISALIASFMSYGSLPLALALFTLFAINKDFKKAAVMIAPNIIYSAYFIFVTIILGMGSPRIIEKISFVSVIKQYLLQILTFIDAMLGPSMWLKVYYSFFQLSPVSIVIGIVITVFLYKIIKKNNARYDPKLIVSLVVLTLASFLIFSLTGRYPQLCFNLGNRVTIFGSLLLTYMIVLMPGPKIIRLIILSLLAFTILGTSDHWKNWNIHQQKVISNMRNNKSLKDYHSTKAVYIKGNQYSKYGPISNIEFFSETWVPGSILQLLFGRSIPASPINRRFRYADGYLTDTKYNNRDKVDGYINVYDSETDELFRVDAGSINDYIDSLPFDKRHWTQLLDNKYVKNVAVRLMPRLSYAF